MVFGKFVKDAADKAAAQEICETVYEKELGIAIPAPGEDFCMDALAFAGDVPAGMGRIVTDGKHFSIAAVAVLKEFRGDSYGDFLVRLLVDRAMMANADEVRLDALDGTQGFFETIGFETDGALFESCGGMWQPMLLRTDRIHKCCNCGGSRQG